MVWSSKEGEKYLLLESVVQNKRIFPLWGHGWKLPSSVFCVPIQILGERIELSHKCVFLSTRVTCSGFFFCFCFVFVLKNYFKYEKLRIIQTLKWHLKITPEWWSHLKITPQELSVTFCHRVLAVICLEMLSCRVFCYW